MALSPAFLDELRLRVALPDVVQRKVRLVKKGREWGGLCPFHNEKSPSFTVNDEKGFFHCFGCGAHGDVIGFVMRIENLGFMEAVERLAAEAGMEVPRATIEEERRVEQQKTLGQVLEAACAFFEGQLRARAGEQARSYFAGRGLDDEACTRFRLGYAPNGTALLKQHLGHDFPDELIEAAGLIRKPEDGRDSFDYFRNRVMFPILDRTGKVVAFGGRVLDDSKPKYLNSPESPVFQKGRTLYGLSWARAGVAKGAEIIVTEGYMDVIALHRAGFTGAVAPLGTALTEEQLELLWRLAPEPILCFDGDAAGQRAAERAMTRALPLIKPGRSLRFATLSGGEDPDTLIRKFGAPAMQAVLTQAKPLADTVWRVSLAKLPATRTPEQRAGLKSALLETVKPIADADTRKEYEGFLLDRFFAWRREQREPVKPPARGFQKGRPAQGRQGWRPHESGVIPDLPPRPDPMLRVQRRRQEVLLRIVLDHPELLDEVVEDFVAAEIAAPDLDKLRHAILNIHSGADALDAATLRHNLSLQGFSAVVDGLFAQDITGHVGFAGRGADRDVAKRGWLQALGSTRHPDREAEVDRAIRRFEEHASDETNAHLQALVREADEEKLAQAAFDDEI
jgi:DNA primase